MRESLKMRTRLRMMTTEEGGRQRAVWSGYRPHVWFGGIGEGQRAYYGVQVTLDAADQAEPGLDVSAILQPLVPASWPDVMPGTTLHLYEGVREVGQAHVRDIVDDHDV